MDGIFPRRTDALRSGSLGARRRVKVLLRPEARLGQRQPNRAQEALRQVSDKLAQATQAASLAELSASIAHEVNQPLAAIVANSNACYRWLPAEPPNLDRAKMTAERITRDANSAADVINRIRALFRRETHAHSPVMSTA